MTGLAERAPGKSLHDLNGLTGFEPDGGRGRAVDARVIAALAGSLDEVTRALSAVADLGAAERGLGAALREGRARLDPVAVSLYFDLLDAVEADDVDAALGRLAALERRSRAPAPGFVTDWGALDPEVRAGFGRALALDPTTVLDLRAPDPARSRAAAALAQEALAALDVAAPGLSAEVRALVAQVVFVAGTVNGANRFDGATGFHAWGALFLNAEEHVDRIEMIDGLAHESGHALLYGLSFGRSFVTNPPEERRPSPLRRDPRPLDGIFHATYVSARMHLAHDRLLAAAAAGRLALAPEELEAAEEGRAYGRTAFRGGLGVLDEFARPTPLGVEVMAGARAYMAAAGA